MPTESIKIKKFTSDETPSYDDHIKPVVQMPESIRQKLSEQETQSVVNQSLGQYSAAKIALDESIADVATKDPDALEFAGEISKRVLIIMEISVQLGLVDVDKINADEAQLKKVGVSSEAIAARSPGLLEQLKINSHRTKVIAESGKKSGVEKGSPNEAGFVGFSPLAIINATTGSLRERMHIPFKTTHGFTKELFSIPENITAINKELSDRGLDWQVNEGIVNGLKEQTENLWGGLYAYGSYASSREGSRVSDSTTESRDEYVSNNPTMKDMQSARMPLSQRELLAQSGDRDPDSSKRVQWTPGEAWSHIADDRTHPSVKAADDTSDLMLTGISGTTDSILTLGHMIGMFDGLDKEDQMRNGMVACMGWMIDAKDHTAHEVQTSGKTFGLDYTPGPDSYKQIRPDDSQFIEQLQRAQASRGYLMPDEYLSSVNVEVLAQPIVHAHQEEARLAPVQDKENAEPNKNILIEKQDKIKEIYRDLRGAESADTIVSHVNLTKD